MLNWLNDICRKFYLSLLHPSLRGDGEERESRLLLEAVKAAKREWETAELYFNEVTDPDLVEYAVFILEAAKRKYLYLWKKSREWEISL
ncbi:MAG: DUF2508 family protein [bacterium]